MQFSRQSRLRALLWLLAFPLCSCGGGGGGSGGAAGGDMSAVDPSYSGKTSAAEITRDNLTALLSGLNDAVPICSFSTQSPAAGRPAVKGLAVTLRSLQRLDRLSDTIGKSSSRVVLGDCGGSFAYKDLLYQDGAIHGTVSLNNVCARMEGGEQEIVNGEINFVNQDGLIRNLLGFQTTSLHADATLLTFARRSATGALLGNDAVSFRGLTFTPASPTSVPTEITVGTYLLDTLNLSSRSGSVERNIMLKNVIVTRHQGDDGIKNEYISGRLYVDTLGYLDAATDPQHPIQVASGGLHQSGEIILSGSLGSNARLTILPAGEPTFALQVGGAPVEGAVLNCVDIPLTQRASQ